MGSYKVALFQALHYVDHDDVEAKESHVKTTIGDVDSKDLSLKSPLALQFKLIES